ncbi:hypothetical protein C8Q74DRAFT_1294604 [Fomes fomentarius]|nr:hypothetical protein C8Q74DRAFT_1294604 [Fomes fomentarius]
MHNASTSKPTSAQRSSYSHIPMLAQSLHRTSTFVDNAQKRCAIILILHDLLDSVTFLLPDNVRLVRTTNSTFSEDDGGDHSAPSNCDMYAQFGARGTSVIFASAL